MTESIKAALKKIDRYNRVPDEATCFGSLMFPFGMAKRKRGKWVLYEDAMTAISQAVKDMEGSK